MLKFVFLPPSDSLKLNHDINYLMTSEDMVEDPLMSVQFYLKSRVFFRVTVHLPHLCFGDEVVGLTDC